MKKKLTREKIQYWFDCVMSKGPIAMSLLLFGTMVVVVVVIGVIAFFVAEEGSLGYQLWVSFMHTLDAGTLAGNDTGNVWYVFLMTLSTLCGLFITSVLIGIIATGVESKLNDLRKGTSVVQEEEHTVIVGFDNNVYALLRELIEANANRKTACIVVLGEQPKDEMEDAIAMRIPDTKTTRIICRSGGLHEATSLERCAVENCRSVIVNTHEDAETVKVLLALSAYIKDKSLLDPQLRFVASLQDSQYVESAQIAGEGRAEIIFAKDAIARIISNTCRQHGLSQVLTELFNFGGNELYFESVPELVGKTMGEAMRSFSNAVPVAICRDGKVQLNPPMDTVIGERDALALLEEDDGAYEYHPAKAFAENRICSASETDAQTSNRLIVLGSNDKLPILLAEYDRYVEPGATVLIADDDLDERRLGTYENLKITVCTESIDREVLCRLLGEYGDNLLLLNDDSLEPEASDSQTLLRLILLRDIADKTDRHFSITTEMRSIDNQRLASQARVDDFVVGSNFISLLMAQISEDPRMMPLVTDLLDETGSELYMKPASDYVRLGEPVDGYTLAESAARHGEVFIGYRHMGKNRSNVVVNAHKGETVVFEKNDLFVVISEN